MDCVERTLADAGGAPYARAGRTRITRAKYYGNLRARDAAYHQGTVWPWLIGPYVDAWLKLHPDELDQCGPIIAGFRRPTGAKRAWIDRRDLRRGSALYASRGCVAQAWSVAEVLRSVVKVATLKKNGESGKPA